MKQYKVCIDKIYLAELEFTDGDLESNQSPEEYVREWIENAPIDEWELQEYNIYGFDMWDLYE